MAAQFIVSEVIMQVFNGPTCWVIYNHPAFNSPVKSNLYAVVNCEYDDGTEESFISPVIASKDGIMTWANYFDAFVGAIHQEDVPSEEQIAAFKKEIEETEREIARILNQHNQAAGSEKEPETTGATIKFQPKKKPGKPDDNK